MAAAGAVSAALGGISRVAVLATPTMETVLAVVGALRAGVEVVPVPSDAGSAELAHILADAQPQAWLGAAPADPQGRPVLPVDVDARSSAEIGRETCRVAGVRKCKSRWSPSLYKQTYFIHIKSHT